jgi:RHS repeat-associated protein
VSDWNGSTHAQLQGKYYWGSQPVAYYESGAAHFEHQDWLGTERMRTTYNGGVEGSFSSLPFGDDLTTVSGTDGDANHYATLDHDYESDTEHAQFRQYSSAQGRWLSPDPYSGSYDPSNPESFNRYTYVQNAPLSFLDPLGLDQYFFADGCLWYSYTVISSDALGSYQIQVLQTMISCSSAAIGTGPNGAPLTGGSGGGNSGSGNGASAPNTGTIKPMSRLDCASYRADKELSIASMTSGSSPDNPVVQAFLGNSFSGVVNLFETSENPLTNLVTGGWNPGVPGIPAPEVGGYALDGGLAGAATKAALGGATDLFALPKLTYDAATFLGAAAFLCR